MSLVKNRKQMFTVHLWKAGLWMILNFFFIFLCVYLNFFYD